MSKQICFILDWYPTPTNNGCIFAKHLIYAIADLGFDCVVIAPRILNVRNERIPYYRTEITEKGSNIRIFTPTYLHFTSRKHMMKLTMNNHFNAVMKVIRKENLHPDVVYGHFIYQCGLTAARVGKKLGVPSYCASGESYRLKNDSFPSSVGLKSCNWHNILSELDGVISVSSYNKELLIDNGFIDDKMPLAVFPNGYNEDIFYKIDRRKARSVLNFPQDVFIIAFTGRFTENKGINELCEALNNLDDVYSVFMGSGDIQPQCHNVLFCDSVDQGKLVLLLNAADVFVLPTRSEGCCNAIVEALACGLPVVSSNLSFNNEILNRKNSIRIDVTDVGQIEKAILQLKQDEILRSNLSSGAEEFSKTLVISKRAKNILRFMRLI